MAFGYFAAGAWEVYHRDWAMMTIWVAYGVSNLAWVWKGAYG